MIKYNEGYLFILPFVIGLIIINIYSRFYSVFVSFMKWDGSKSPAVFIGLSNYIRLVHDKYFFMSIGNTWIMWLCGFIPQMVIALWLAVVLNDEHLKGRSIFRAIFYLPNLITMASIGALFSFILDWQTGSLNKLLMSMHIISHKVNWLQSPAATRGTVSFTLWWIWFGYSMIIFMAGLKTISSDYYDAACVDGASKWQSFKYITLPLLQPTILYQVVTSVIGGLTLFDVPFVLSGGNGAPLYKSLTMVMYLYNTAFKNYNFGYSGAIGVGLFIMVAILVGISFKVIYKKKVYE